MKSILMANYTGLRVFNYLHVYNQQPPELGGFFNSINGNRKKNTQRIYSYGRESCHAKLEGIAGSAHVQQKCAEPVDFEGATYDWGVKRSQVQFLSSDH